MISNILAGRALALTGAIFWSITGVTVRHMEEATEWQINFYRSSTLTVFVLLTLLGRYRGAAIGAIAATGVTGMVAGALVGLSMIANIVALKHTSVANAVLLMACGPVVAAIFGRMLLKEQVDRRTWGSIALTFAGITLMVGGGGSAASLFGDLVALLGVVLFGLYTIALRRGAHLDMTPAVFYAGAFSATISALVLLGTGTGFSASRFDVGLCVMLGVVQLGVGSVLFALAASALPAAELALFSLAEPVLAPLWTWLGVGEVPSTASLLGGAVIIAALVIQTTGSLRRA